MAEEFVPPPGGWVDDQQAVWATKERLEKTGNGPAVFAFAAPHLKAAADDEPVFLWQAERTRFGKLLDSWDQGQTGACVSFGCGRAVQDVILVEAEAAGASWPGAEVATEPIYGGSRVEVGGGQLRGSDGSVGAWAADWVRKWGILLRQVYTEAAGTFDLTKYSESRARQWGDAGCPDPLEPEAKLHPVSAVALVRDAGELWAALGGGKGVSIASNQGFNYQRDADGFCAPSGVWMHQMCARGKFIHPTRGKCFVIQNSWGNYLTTNAAVRVKLPDGTQRTEPLPQGCFAVDWTVADRMVRQQDSWAYAGVKGWEPVKLTWNPLA